MQIDDIRTERRGDRQRIAATIIWEERNQTPQVIYYETPDLGADEFEANADTFLLTTLPLAVWFAERRVRIGGAVCPRLRDGLQTMMTVFHSWYPDKPPVTIDPAAGYRPRLPRERRRAAAFLSGGIDSLALFRANRAEYPLDHPASFRDGVFLFGLNNFDFDGADADPERVAAFDANVSRLRDLASSIDVTLISGATNVRTLYPDYATWAGIGLTAGTFGIAQAMGTRVTDAWAAGDSADPQTQVRSQAQKLHLHHYSSSAVEFHLGQQALSRFEKTRLVADWPEALARLRSCLNFELPAAGQLNCGRCEKCVRTMLALLALGKLRDTTAFPFDDLTPDMLAPLKARSATRAAYYADVIEPLEQQGRSDLSSAIRAKLDEFERLSVAESSRSGWKRRLGDWLGRYGRSAIARSG